MKTKKNFTFLILIILLCGSLSESYGVGALFVRPLRSDQAHEKMWMKTVDIKTTIQNQIAATHADQLFYNEMATQVEAVFVFPLPPGAVITELVYWFNGQRYVGQIRELQDAINEYNEKIRQYLDPALLQYLGDNLFRLNIAPINAQSDVRFEITYTQLLNYDFGRVTYDFLLNTTSLSPRPLDRLSLDIDVQTQAPIKFLNSPSHSNSTAMMITKLSDFNYQVLFGDENFHPDQDFRLEFETVRENVDICVLTYTPTEADSFGEDSFYSLWIIPPDSVDTEAIIPKNIVFTVDVSSSMEGERLEQLKIALNNFLDHLLPIDRFNIVTFGTNVQKFKSNLIKATATNIAEAREYVRQLVALGLTNINQALIKSLNQSYQDTTMNILVFLTDGYPTWDETDINQILLNTKTANLKSTHIFAFGIGTDISTVLLGNLSQENGGYAQYITADDSIALMVQNHFQRISMPVLDDLKIKIPGLQSLDKFPRSLPALFWGRQVLELGRYSNSGAFDVTLEAKTHGRSVSYTNTVFFADTIDGCRFVPRLWAKSKIDYLLREIEIYGELDELVNAIIDLSIRFGILTPYTALYADPQTGVEKVVTKNLVENFILEQNYPNPFNPETEITYHLLEKNGSFKVRLRIYDALGRLVKELINKEQAPGIYKVKWDGTNMLNERVPSGLYICVLEIGTIRLTRKMMLLK